MPGKPDDLDVYASHGFSLDEWRGKLWVVGWVAIVAIPALWAVASLGKGGEPPGPRGWIGVAPVEELAEADVMYSERSQIFIVHGDEPLALSAISPHGEHTLGWCKEAEVFQGEHGELFDRNGVYLGGPSPRSMDRLAVRVLDGTVEVAPDRVTEVGRDEYEPIELSGQLCDPA
jgi:nitrite reductase/ring-hydroxylating ferredoxin subunit